MDFIGREWPLLRPTRFAIIGFEDSVNMVEETTNPQCDFPRAFFIGITITGVV
jgi:amino acid transporter